MVLGAADGIRERHRAELLAVDGDANQAKGDSGPAEWLPPDPSGTCDYVQRYIRVAAAYRLAITAAEHETIARILTTCH